MKVLNLYAGIGGNRKLWEDVDVAAVEIDEDVAKVYQDYFPEDEVIIADAHEYLLEHYDEFDFIWISNPCTSHSRGRFWAHKNTNPVYPDFSLYEEIVFLQYHAKSKWVAENVIPYYEELVPPTRVIGRHNFWSNFRIGHFEAPDSNIWDGNKELWQQELGISIEGYSFSQRTDKILRNCVHPEIGKYILERAKGIYRKSQTSQTALFNH